MLIAAAFILLITIFLGISNIINLLQNYFRSQAVVIIHGSLAILALVLIFIHIIVIGYSSILLASFVVLFLTALGGLTLLSYRLKHKRAPVVIIILHPIIAIIGFFLLIISQLP